MNPSPTVLGGGSAPAREAPPRVPAPLARRVASQGRFELLSILRNGEQLLLSFIIPLLLLVGLVSTGVLDKEAAREGVSPVQLVVPGVLGVCVLSTGFTGQAISTGFDRRYGVLKYLATTPLGRSGLMWGKVLAVSAVIAAQICIMLLVGGFLGWSAEPAGVALAVPVVLLGAACFTSLGLLMAGTLRAEATLALANLAFVALVALGGLVYPVSSLPGWIQPAAQWLPSGLLGDGLRAALLRGEFDLAAAGGLAGWMALFTAGCATSFRWKA